MEFHSFVLRAITGTPTTRRWATDVWRGALTVVIPAQLEAIGPLLQNYLQNTAARRTRSISGWWITSHRSRTQIKDQPRRTAPRPPAHQRHTLLDGTTDIMDWSDIRDSVPGRTDGRHLRTIELENTGQKGGHS